MLKRYLRNYICIRQHDITDCGAACLATIFRYYGLKMTVTKLRDISGTDRDGTTAFGLIKAARNMGFDAKGIKMDKEAIAEEISLPAIAHVIVENKRLHYVVVYEVNNDKVLVADPAKGILKYNKKEFFKIWTGALILLKPGSDFTPVNNMSQSFLLTFYKMVFPLKRRLIKIFLISIVYVILGILGSFYIKILFDDILVERLKESLHRISLGFIALLVIQVILLYFRSIILVKLGIIIDRNLMLKYYKHVLNLPMKFFDTRKVGEIISRFMDASKIREVIAGATLTLMIDTLMALIGGIILYIQNSVLFMVSLCIIIFYTIIVVFFNKPIRKINQIQMENNAKLTSYLVESLEGVETVKSFNIENMIYKKTEKKFDVLIESILKGTSINALLGTLTSGISGLGTIVLLWIGTYFILDNKMSSGDLLAFNALLVYFLNPIKNLISLQSSIQTAIVASRRLGEILELEHEKDSVKLDDDISKNIVIAGFKEITINKPDLFAPIKIENVLFRYGSHRPVLRNLNIDIKQGEKIAIVGESGSGKTTLLKLLMRFYKPEEGSIKIGNIDIEEIPLSYLRRRISLVSQQSFLFSGTIKDNLCLKDDIDTDSLINAAKIAQIHDFIEKLPLKYDTYLEENGSNLSGGQKQRLAIARAILKEPDIFMMDEATSNIDSITEKALEKTINEWKNRVTTIVVAHRISTIMNCNKIFVMDEGNIIEHGTHEELIKNCYLYRKMNSLE